MPMGMNCPGAKSKPQNKHESSGEIQAQISVELFSLVHFLDYSVIDNRLLPYFFPPFLVVVRREGPRAFCAFKFQAATAETMIWMEKGIQKVEDRDMMG